jgi:hypothetical protein
LHTILRLPQNALRHADFLNLESLGGPKLRSIVASCAAALHRTATITITKWPEWITQLEIAAQAHLPLADLARLSLTPSFWDSPPIACNLREAARGFPSDRRWMEGAADAILKIQQSQSNKIKVQRVFYTMLIKHRFVDTLVDTLETRLTALFSPFIIDFRNTVSLSRCLATLKGCSISVSCKVLKCWINGWATSTRYHEDYVLPCLFGCHACSDSMRHYLLCPHLFALWVFLAGGASADPLVRWGLIYPTRIDMIYVSCIFSGYHAIRQDLRAHPSLLDPEQLALTPAQLRRAWSVFGDTFKVEARELSIPFKQFSLPEFLMTIT